MSVYTVTKRDFGLPRPEIVRLMIGQIKTGHNDWVQRGGLFFAKDVSKVRGVIERLLVVARQNTVEALVLPELSVPIDCINVLQTWSSETGGTVVGGSHYHLEEGRYIARCPVIVRGEVVFTEKIVPAPIEVSPVANEGLCAGKNVVLFTGTPLGNFGVLICSDYLDPELRQMILRNSLDLFVVPAFQKGSEKYHSRMSIDCEEYEEGLYLVYSNMISPDVGDGRSGLFGVMDKLFFDKLKAGQITDGNPPHKVCEIPTSHDYVIADIDFSHKRFTLPHTVHSRPNIKIVSRGGGPAGMQNRFVELIAHDDDKYRQIENLYVPPKEYPEMLKRLEQSRILFVVGDPGIGKTYTAAMLLKHYFDKEYRPVWYTGLERDERKIQRLTLESFEPGHKQVVYFEDPFGRLAFEKRESLFNVFGPMIDKLQHTDARIIITSRKEIFERFLEESLSEAQIGEFVEQMNLIKPSYAPNDLKQILDKLASMKCDWYTDEKCRTVVEQAIVRGQLTTPLAIRDLVYSTEHETRVQMLKSAIRRRGEEQTIELAREVIACDPMSKLLFALVYLFGFKEQSYLIRLFDLLVKRLELTEDVSRHVSFAQLLRDQLGYRLERSGAVRSNIRFAHPAYEEAVAAAGTQDSTLELMLTAAIEAAYEQDFTSCMKAINRHAETHPRLSAQLFCGFADLIAHKNSLHEIITLGTRVVSLYHTTQNAQFLPAVEQFAHPVPLAKRINDTEDNRLLASSLRFVHNYDRAIGISAGKSVAPHIVWETVFRHIRQDRSLQGLLEVVEWAHLLAPAETVNFLNSITPSKLFMRRSILLLPKHHERAKRAFQGTTLYDKLIAFSESGVQSKSAWRRAIKDSAATIPNHPAVVIDQELARIFAEKDVSLLPAGVADVVGEFSETDTISVLELSGARIGIAMTEYNSHDIRDIKGHHSSQIAEIIGKYHGPSVISRRFFVRVGPSMLEIDSNCGVTG